MLLNNESFNALMACKEILLKQIKSGLDSNGEHTDIEVTFQNTYESDAVLNTVRSIWLDKEKGIIMVKIEDEYLGPHTLPAELLSIDILAEIITYL